MPANPSRPKVAGSGTTIVEPLKLLNDPGVDNVIVVRFVNE